MVVVANFWWLVYQIVFSTAVLSDWKYEQNHTFETEYCFGTNVLPVGSEVVIFSVLIDNTLQNGKV